MRVGFDDQIFLLQRRGGISRYVVELIRQFDTGADGVEPVLPFSLVANDLAVRGLSHYGLEDVTGWRRTAHIARRRLVLPRRPSVDLVHHTHTDARLRPQFRRDAPTALTVHDMIPELYPDAVPASAHLDKDRFLAEADLIIADSRSTAADLVRLRSPRAPVVVVPLGVDARFRPGSATLADWPPRYVLTVGARAGYKDFPVLLEAFATLARRHPDLHLCSVGGGRWLPEEERAIMRLGLAGRVRQATLTDAQLVAAYANAGVFALPSRYEGFGLPLLEAMACGSPAVAAASSSLPEVGGDAARYFPPGDAGRLAEALAELLDDPAARARAVERGLARAAGFTWRRTAELTAAAYRRLIS